MFNKSLIAALCLLAAPALAQEDGPGPNLIIDVTGVANGQIVIDLLPEVAPLHVAQVVAIAKSGAYDGVVFHRVIEGFMAQTGDVANGRAGGDTSAAGTGGSNLPNIPAEFNATSFDRGVLGMGRSMDPNSANSQFFIMFAPAPHLDGQYTALGRVISGMEIVDMIKRGEGGNGEVASAPDVMTKVTVQE